MKNTKMKGSMTVELALIFPLILIIILGVLRLCIMQYQNMMVATSAMQAAARGAAYWNVLGREGMDLSRGVGADYTQHDPYRYLLDTRQTAKDENIKRYAEDLIGKKHDTDFGDHKKLMDDKGTVKVEKTGNILQKYVSVTVNKKIVNPMAPLLGRIGIKVPDSTTITAKAPLNTPTEFIRNVSFIYDMVQERKNGSS